MFAISLFRLANRSGVSGIRYFPFAVATILVIRTSSVTRV